MVHRCAELWVRLKATYVMIFIRVRVRLWVCLRASYAGMKGCTVIRVRVRLRPIGPKPCFMIRVTGLSKMATGCIY